MTYVVDISLALIRVLEGAAFFRDERLAGYAANTEFWAAEVRHALDVIGGHESRVSNWRSAVQACPTEAPISAADLSKLNKRLRAAATRFFRLCGPHLERGLILEIEQLLGIKIEHISQDYRD